MKNDFTVRRLLDAIFSPSPCEEFKMVRNQTVRFRHRLSCRLALSLALLFIVGSAPAADSIFDDDDAVDAAPLDALKPSNAQAPVGKPAAAKPAAVAEAKPATAQPVAIPNPPALPEEGDKTAVAVATAGTPTGPADATAPENKNPTKADAAATPAVANNTPAADKPAENKPPEQPAIEPEKVGVAAAKVGKVEKEKDNLGQRREKEVGRNEELGYLQSKVTAQMLELEERMYRLSEALKSLEPENASRLLIGLKYAREELIQLQMKEIQAALTSQNFRDAINEEKQVLAKLQRLEQLLLSPDLDFQLQLERLRLMRDLLKRLDLAIKEEDREKTMTDGTVEIEKKLEELRKRKATLRDLIASQTKHIETGESLVKPDADKTDSKPKSEATPASEEKSRSEIIETLATDQAKTREQTAALENTAKPIAEAGTKMEQAVDQLKKSQPDAALPNQNAALDSLKKALQDLEAEEKKLEAELAEEKFLAMKKEQAGNRKTTETISEMAVQLGDAGAAARSELIRAGGSMSNAEQSFGGRNAGSADASQGEALASLKYARELLEGEIEKMLNRLRGEIKKRTIEGLIQMLEGQIAIRETTERLGPKVKDGERAVLTAVTGLATAEGKLIAIGEGLTALVEETEFGIALPAALRSVTDAMSDVRERLAATDASEEVVASEKIIEEDLQALLEAMKQLPSQSDGKGEKGNGGAGRRERQLNRLIAELKMVKMLQLRVNRDTKDVDQKKPEDLKTLTASLKRRIDSIHDRQDDVHDVTEQISIERGNELPQ